MFAPTIRYGSAVVTREIGRYDRADVSYLGHNGIGLVERFSGAEAYVRACRFAKSRAAVDTRRLTGIMRDIARAYTGSFARAGMTLSVVLDRRYGRRRYAIEYQSPTRAGWLMHIDTTYRMAYVRPVTRATRTDDVVDATARDIAFCTLYLDALFDELSNQGYMPDTYSETLATLNAARVSRDV